MTIEYIPVEKARKTCVSFNISYKANPWLITAYFESLAKYGNKMAHETATLVAFREYVESKLAKEKTLGKISELEFGYSDDNLIVSVTVKDNATACRTAIRQIVKNMDASKCYSKYQTAIRVFGEKPSRDYFNNCARSLNDSVGKMKVLIIGKVKIDTAKMTAIKAAFKEAIDKSTGSSIEAGTKPPAGKDEPFTGVIAKGKGCTKAFILYRACKKSVPEKFYYINGNIATESKHLKDVSKLADREAKEIEKMGGLIVLDGVSGGFICIDCAKADVGKITTAFVKGAF
jgi:hypothetical protein